MTDPKLLSDEGLITRAEEIRDYFHEYSEGDPFGWDWPTMNAVFPELVAEYKTLKAEYLRRHPEAIPYEARREGG